MKNLSSAYRFVFQVSVVALVVVGVGFFLFHFSFDKVEKMVLLLMFLWTLWLLLFTRVLVDTHGKAWMARTTVETLQHLAAYSRLSLMIFFGAAFSLICGLYGVLEAQLQLTFFTV